MFSMRLPPGRRFQPRKDLSACLYPPPPRWHPLHVAAYEGDVERTQLLLIETGSDPDLKDPEERTPLHWTTIQDKSDTAEILISNAANIDEQNINKQVPLHEAVNYTSLDTVETLVYSGADVNIQDEIGNTPLHNAAFRVSLLDEEAYKKQQKIHNILLFVGNADPNVQNNDGDTAVHGAAQNGYSEMVAQNVESDPGVIHIKDKKGQFPIHEASRKLNDLNQIRSELCPETANKSILAMSNHYALDMPPILASLIKHLQTSPFFIPAATDSRSDHAEVVQILIDAGADPNARDDELWTPLHGAAESGDKEVAKVLLKAGSDPKAKNNKGLTPLDIARNRGHRDVVQMLKRLTRVVPRLPFSF